MLIGREAERARLDDLLDRARRGTSGALVIRGEAGIGKTALLDYALGRANEMTVVHTLGIESEAELGFSALLDVCRPLLGHLGEIPKPHAESLRAALDLGPAVTVDRFAVGAATLGLLAAAAETQPLLVLIDDAHWLDPSSADALLFATRRLQADRVVVLYAVREGEGRPLDTAGLESILLAGLSREAATSLVQAQIEIAPEVAELLYQETGGNPLALIELPGLLSPEQMTGVAPLDDPLPVGSSVERAFARRVAALPTPSRRALLVAAVSLSNALEPLIDALETLGVPATALEPAEDNGLVKLVGEQFEFGHPLVRSAVYQAAPPSERRAAHRALADSLAESDHGLRAWHLAAAALGPDEEIATLLEAVAHRARERNAHAEAAVALERAARLSPDPAMRVARFAQAAEAAWVVADPGRALGLIDAAENGPGGPAERARLLGLRGVIERRTGMYSTARDLLLEAESLIAPESPSEAANILLTAVPVAFWAGDLPAALEMARRLRQLAPRDETASDGIADATLGWILFLSGNADEGTPVLERAAEVMLAPEEPSRFQLYSAAVALSLLEQTAEADVLALRASGMARKEGAPRAVLVALDALTPADVRAGRWELAVAHGEEGLVLARELGHADQHASIAIELAKLDAARGQENRCRERLGECIRLADEHGIVTMRVASQAVLGVLELGLGRSIEAVEQLERVTADVERLGIHDRDLSPHPDLMEALVRSGRRDEAATVLESYAERAPRGTPLWGGALVARGRGMLVEDDDEAEAHFEEALALHARVEDRFQHARTLLAFGERLRRSGHRRNARERLRAAHELLEELGADPWVQRARQELRASGERLRRRESTRVRAADAAGAPDCPSGRGRQDQQGGRGRPFPEPQDRGVPLEPHLPQAGPQLPGRADPTLRVGDAACSDALVGLSAAVPPSPAALRVELVTSSP